MRVLKCKVIRHVQLKSQLLSVVLPLVFLSHLTLTKLVHNLNHVDRPHFHVRHYCLHYKCPHAKVQILICELVQSAFDACETTLWTNIKTLTIYKRTLLWSCHEVKACKHLLILLISIECDRLHIIIVHMMTFVAACPDQHLFFHSPCYCHYLYMLAQAINDHILPYIATVPLPCI